MKIGEMLDDNFSINDYLNNRLGGMLSEKIMVKLIL
jgi:hypothetical protein